MHIKTKHVYLKLIIAMLDSAKWILNTMNVVLLKRDTYQQ